MITKHSFSLKAHNTFGIEAKAECYIEVESADDLRLCFQNGIFSKPYLILGGGSNILFCNDFNGTVIHPTMKGISVIKKSEQYVIIEAKAGVVWDDLVAYAVENNFYGIENLSFIPGNVGACPVQNIGAYGTEVKDVIFEVEAFDIRDASIKRFSNAECEFDYRESIFKTKEFGNYIVTSVLFKLNLTPHFNIDYKDVKEYLSGCSNITLSTIRDAIIAIRKKKLPDPSEIGNAGSFFKNPIVDFGKAKELKTQFPDIIQYELPNGQIKLAAGWLIDKAGWKGYKCGDAGVHHVQALVLVNYGEACGNEIITLAADIEDSVMKTFGVKISPEVRIVK